MRIFYVVDGLQVGGAESVVTNYLVWLKKQGYDVALVELHKVNSFLRQQIIDRNISIYTLYPQRKNLLDRLWQKLFGKLYSIGKFNKF